MSNDINYDNFAKTFAKSRRNMKWEEIYYFFSFIKKFEWLNILDVWCWSWRLIEHIKTHFDWNFDYLWVDSSKDLLSEAQKQNADFEFLNQNMTDLNLSQKYDLIFLIASFHHLKNIEDRLKTLENLKKYSKPGTKIFLTNWALNSELNYEKYKNNIIPNSENEFWSLDYNIKIGEYYRYYHCFNLQELDFLFNEIWFKIIENKLFENDKNFVSILEV